MMFAFAGISLLPYILADLVIDAGTKIMAFYTWLGFVAYFGWARLLMETDDKNYRRPPLKIMQCLEGFYSNAASVISALFCLKTVSTFPLIFWPLYREVDLVFMFDESPAVNLKLPWAIRRQHRQKLIVKVVLIAMTLVAALVLEKGSFAFIAFACLNIAMNFTQFIFPAWSLALAIRRHVKLLESRKLAKQAGDNGNMEGGSSEVNYIFGSLKLHYNIVH